MGTVVIVTYVMLQLFLQVTYQGKGVILLDLLVFGLVNVIFDGELFIVKMHIVM